ncbi:MAG: hypothetical protein KAS39_08065, partial [Actinomycetia bacterium]|nr:hypothetical protein [Actinomycetes bacterium]
KMKIKSINFYIFRSILKIFIIGSVIYPFLLFSVSTGSVSINQLEFSPESAGVGAYSGKTGVISFDNPGSVSFTRSKSVSLIHGFHMNSFLGEGFTLLLPAQGAFSFGVELKSLLSPKIDLYTGENISSGTGRYFSMGARLLLGFNIKDRVGFGFNLGYTGEFLPYIKSTDNIKFYKKNTFFVDAGFNIRIWKELYFGVNVNNIRVITLPYMYIRYKEEIFPLSLKTGPYYTYRFKKENSLIESFSLSANFYCKYEMIFRGIVGGEVKSRKFFGKMNVILRAGISFPEPYVVSGLRIGGGIIFKGLSVDISYRPFLAAGNQILFSLKYSFINKSLRRNSAIQEYNKDPLENPLKIA